MIWLFLILNIVITAITWYVLFKFDGRLNTLIELVSNINQSVIKSKSIIETLQTNDKTLQKNIEIVNKRVINEGHKSRSVTKREVNKNNDAKRINADLHPWLEKYNNKLDPEE